MCISKADLRQFYPSRNVIITGKTFKIAQANAHLGRFVRQGVGLCANRKGDSIYLFAQLASTTAYKPILCSPKYELFVPQTIRLLPQKGTTIEFFLSLPSYSENAYDRRKHCGITTSQYDRLYSLVLQKASRSRGSLYFE